MKMMQLLTNSIGR